MKRVFTCLALLFTFLLSAAPRLHACDRSTLQLNSFAFDGLTGRWTLNITLAIGGGSLGGIQGGDNYTGNLIFSFRMQTGSTPISPTVHSFLPGTITSDVLLRNANGATVAPGSTWPFGPEAGILRYTVVSGTPLGKYICITPTSICGTPHTDYQTFTFVVSPLPDTIYALGVEGGGNFRAGCLLTDRTDITLLPTIICPVTWSDFSVYPVHNGIQVDFSTAQERNCHYFSVLRAASDGIDFDEIGQVQAVGNSRQAQAYHFTDMAPLPGANRYKIRQYDLDGKHDETQIITVQYTPPQGMALLNLYPVPATEYVDAGFRSAAGGETVVEVYDVRGVLVFRNSFQALAGYNSSRIDVTALPPGSYAVLLRCGEESLRTRFVKRS